MPTKTVRAVGRGCAQQAAIAGFAFTALVLLLGGAFAIGVLIPIPAELGIERRFVVFLTLFAATTGLIVTSLVGSSAFVVRRALWLDDAFASVGLEGRPFFQTGRQYHGTWGGRRVDAYLFRGPTLDLYVESPLGARVGVANRSAASVVARALLDVAPLPFVAPGFEELEVHPDDRAWAEALLADPAAVDLIPRLARDDLGPERRALIVGPEAITLKMRFLPLHDITPTSVRAWVEDMAELARRAEEVAPPAVPARETSYERLMRVERGRLGNQVSNTVLILFVLVMLAGLFVVGVQVGQALR